MRKFIAFCSLFLMSPWAFALGAPFTGSGINALTDTTGTVNQVTTPKDNEGHQDKQWEQEEEDLDTTDMEKNKAQKQEEQRQEEEIRLKDSAIDSYRYDEPDGKTYKEK